MKDYEYDPTHDPSHNAQDERDARTWAMLLHLSPLTAYFSFGLGWLLPILIWQFKKDRHPSLDEHGREATNWVISQLIYGLLFGVLVFVGIGVFLLIALGVLAVVYPIIGGIKASDGQLWRYPGNIRIL